MLQISPSRSPYSTRKSPGKDKNIVDNKNNNSDNNSNDDDSDNSSSDGEISSKFNNLREVVKNHPRVRQAKKSLRLVKKMEKITTSDRYHELMKEDFDIPNSSDDDDDGNENQGEHNNNNNNNHHNDNKKHKENEKNAMTKSIMEGPSDPKMKNAMLMAASLDQLQLDPRSSAFSSDKLCAEFLQAARLAGSIQVSTDDIVEIILEEVTQYWSNPDIYPIVRDALEAAAELERHCRDDLEQSAIRFCGAADRVIKGAREEVRSLREEIAGVQALNERYVARIEDVKSKLLHEAQRAEHLKLAISARRLCLLENGQEFSKIFSAETREALMHEVGTQEVFGQGIETPNNVAVAGNDDLFAENDNNDGGDNNNNNNDENNISSPLPASSSQLLTRHGSSFVNVNSKKPTVDQYRQSIRSRLRMLLSAAIMQVKGQKTADERVLLASSSTMNAGGKYATSQQSPVGSSRILQALETILSNL